MRKPAWGKRAPLITAHAEGIRAGVLSEGLLAGFRKAVGRTTGLYILYSGKSPYYVGLASSLRSRLKKHTEDHLKGKWDRFSMFQVKKAKYLKDLESLAIRVAKPTANKSIPDFCQHHNFTKKITRTVLAAAKAQIQ
jgi:predicted GIY-YIG superfamily endonuclease